MAVSGVLPLFDPPREDAKSTIATALKMGVKIKMVTGDALAIARETAKTLGMGTNILDGGTLGDSKTEETAAEANPSKSRRIRPGFPGAQIPYRRRAAKAWPHCRHDRRWGERCSRTEEGRLRLRRLGRDGCGARSGLYRAADAGAIGHYRRDQGEPEIFQRMNSYAIYRIAETLRVLLFMTLAIVIFNFYPLTAIMIVMLALLNDGAILSIAYDNVLYRNQPEAWNMRLVLGIATVLGLFGSCAAFGLFYLGEHIFHLDLPQIQTMMYLMLSVAGHLTIFQTRTRGPWWSIRPAQILLLAVFGTQTVATLICLRAFHYASRLGLGGVGLGLCPGLVPGDRPVKLLAYRFSMTSTETRSEAKATSSSKARHRPSSESKHENPPERFSRDRRRQGRSQEMADEGRSRVQVEAPIQENAGGAYCAAERATAASLRIESIRHPVDFPGDGCGGKRWRYQACDVRD